MCHVSSLIPLYFSSTFTPPPSDILKILVLRRNVDRPELCQISLYDFQKFLQMDQKVLSKSGTRQRSSRKFSLKTALYSLLYSGSSQESWASELSRVREFLMGYMRGGPQPEPMLQLDEVKQDTNAPTCTKNRSKRFFPAVSYLNCLIVWSFYRPSSWPSCSLKRTPYVTLDIHLLFTKTWKDHCLSTGSPPRTTRRSRNLSSGFSNARIAKSTHRPLCKEFVSVTPIYDQI